MDPNRALADFREAVRSAREPHLRDADRARYTALAMQAAEALDEWLSKGGSLPAAWTRSRADF